jgi:hypothetical protein
MLVCLMVPFRSLWLCSLFFNFFFFLFLRLNDFHFVIFKFTDSFFCLLRLPFESLYWFFISVIILFSSSSFRTFFVDFSVSLLVFLLYMSCNFLLLLKTGYQNLNIIIW